MKSNDGHIIREAKCIDCNTVLYRRINDTKVARYHPCSVKLRIGMVVSKETIRKIKETRYKNHSKVEHHKRIENLQLMNRNNHVVDAVAKGQIKLLKNKVGKLEQKICNMDIELTVLRNIVNGDRENKHIKTDDIKEGLQLGML